MNPIIEILLFALLSGYFFYRLWLILGTRIDDEKSTVSEAEADEIYTSDESSQRNESIYSPLSAEITQKCTEIKRILPEFNLENFLEGAQEAFKLILDAYRRGDKDTLKKFLNSSVYKEFLGAIEDREINGQTIELEVGQIKKITIDTVNIATNHIQIVLIFISEQMFATHDNKGVIIDNPARLSIEMRDKWTFEKKLSSRAPLWTLIATQMN